MKRIKGIVLKRNELFRITTLIVVLVFVGACSTKKNTWMSRNYHNMTAKYNIYFNGYESYMKGWEKIETGALKNDNYNEILDLFYYSDISVVRSALPNMNKTIKKCSKVIKQHSIKSKPKRKSRGKMSDKDRAFYNKTEYCEFVDDAYLLMGMSHLMKHDYFPAQSSFEYIIKEYSKEEIRFDAYLWLIRTFNEMKRFTQAQELLMQLDSDPEFPASYRSEYMAIYADFFLKQEKFEDAYTWLKLAVEGASKKKDKIRYTTILAQVAEELEYLDDAFNYYGLVAKMNPDYKIAFNVEIKRAELYQGDAEGGEEIVKKLNKMLKDEKNEEYLDQIYYALAAISINEGRMDEAKEYLALSSAKNLTNVYQKALSNKKLAEIYFEEEDYINSYQRYDTCMSVIDEEFPDYQKIYDLHADLSILAENLKVVEVQDSLQTLAQMPKEELNALIDSMIALAVERKKQEDELQQMGMNNRNNRMNQMGNMSAAGGLGGNAGGAAMGGGAMGAGGAGMGGPVGSNFYFYNPGTVSYGQTEFRKFWGRRKLEDNWRRSNKKLASSMNDMGEEGEEGEISSINAPGLTQTVTDATKREYYTENIPDNDSLMDLSHKALAQGLFNSGKIFKDAFEMYDKAEQQLETLLENYPENSNLLFTYYNLYEINKSQKDRINMDKYKNLILENYPDSRSAKIISNPNYFKELYEADQKVADFYEETYMAFSEGKHDMVLQNCEYADTGFVRNKMRDKFAFLHLQSISSLNPSDTAMLKSQYEEFIFNYPESKLLANAKSTLNVIERGIRAFSGDSGKTGFDLAEEVTAEPEVSYSYNENQVHYYILIAENDSKKINQLKFNISNYNTDHYVEDFFQVSSILFNADLQMITVKSFRNLKDAMEYFYLLDKDLTVFEGYAPTDFRKFIISKENYPVFYKNKNINYYMKFFNGNYLGK